MFESSKQALQKLGREIRRLEDAENHAGMTEIDFSDCHDSVMNAATTAWHLNDWTFQDISKRGKIKNNFEEFRKEREAECHDLSLCGDIANKVKHAIISRFRTIDGKTDMETTATSFTSLEISQKGVRANVQKCTITLNEKRAVDIFQNAFNYWSQYLKKCLDIETEMTEPNMHQQPATGSVSRAGGYYCPKCKTAIAVLIPHSDKCRSCGTLYENIPT